MKNEEFNEIATIIDKIKATNVYETYAYSHRALVTNAAALRLLDGYHHAQEVYVANNDDYTIAETIKQETRRALLAKKNEINNNNLIHHYLVMQRTIEFFVDDLNYEINQMLGKQQKKQCGTHRK